MKKDLDVIKRGDIYYANLNPVIGSEQSGIRPVLVVQNNTGNKYSSTVIVVAITSKLKENLPTHVSIDGIKYGLEKKSVILAEQVRTLDKKRLIKKIGKIDSIVMDKVKKAIRISFGLRASFEEIIKLLNNA